MPGVSRVGVDVAGGVIVGNLAPTVYVDGAPIAVKGAFVSGHGRGPHAGPVMVGSSESVFAHGILVCRQGDSATCGHGASGSGDVFAGGAPTSSAFIGSVVAPPAQLNEKAVTSVRAQTTDYISNPTSYNNPAAAANGVKQAYAPVPTEVSTGTVAPSEAAGNDIVPFLTLILNEAKTGQWRESGQGGNPSNKNITGIWKELGFPTANPWNTDQTAWCMGFLNWVLKKTGYRWAQEAGSRALKNKPQRWNATEVPISEAQPGDLVLWNFGHVNFVYANNNGKLSFCGGNQTPTSGSNNNPDDGDVTISWPSGWTPIKGGITGIWRPSRS